MSMKENAEMIKEFVDTETGEPLADPVDILSAEVADLREHVEVLLKFARSQIQINSVQKFLIKKKYTEKELEIALDEFKDAQKRLRSEDKKEEKSE